MGQKLNPIIFRLGINKTWKTEFFEKKNHELPLYVFKDLEIKSYIERVFEANGIIVHDYKQHYNASTLNLYVSYFVTSDFVSSNRKGNEQLKINSVAGSKSTIRKTIGKSCAPDLILSNEMINSSSRGFSNFYKIKKYLKLSSYHQLSAQVLSKNLVVAQNNKYLNYSRTQADSLIEGFTKKVFTVLNLFLTSQLNLVVNFCCINKNVQFLKSTQKKTFISFQKFKNTPFFNGGIELLFSVAHDKNSANLLAKFIAFQFKKVKRHKFFLSFLKQILTTLMDSNLSKIKGVKIIVKGRLNGVPRAKHKIMVVGDVPVQTISANLDYSQATAHDSNGSYGIKVWVVEK